MNSANDSFVMAELHTHRSDEEITIVRLVLDGYPRRFDVILCGVPNLGMPGRIKPRPHEHCEGEPDYRRDRRRLVIDGMFDFLNRFEQIIKTCLGVVHGVRL